MFTVNIFTIPVVQATLGVSYKGLPETFDVANLGVLCTHYFVVEVGQEVVLEKIRLIVMGLSPNFFSNIR